MTRPPLMNGGNESTLSGETDAARRLRLFETIVSSTPDLVYVFGLDHRFIFANEALLEMWGKSRDEAIGRNCLELGYEPWHAEMHDREIEQVRSTGKPIRGEVPFAGMNGRRIYDYIFTPVFGVDGQVEAVAGITRDVTERKEAETVARELFEQNAQILESITDAFFALDRDFRLTFLNKQAETVLGAEHGALLGRSLWEEFPGLVGSEFERTYRRVMDDGEPASLLSYYPDHERWYQVNVYPSSGGLTIYFRNVTEEKEAEEALRRSERKLEQQARIFDTTLSAITDFAYTFDRSGRFTYANRALTDLLQIRPDEIIGKNFFELGYPDSLAGRLQKQIEDVFVTGKPVRDETEFVDPSGNRGFYEYIFNPIINTAGEVEAVAGSTRDITERVLASNALKNVEHELRTAIEFDDAIMDNMGEGLYAVDTSGALVMMNRAAERLLGRSLDECRGMNMHSLMHYIHRDGTPYSVEECERRFAREGSHISNARDVFVRSDGSFFDTVYTAAPLVTAGEVTGSVVVFRDATEETRSEERLRESESRFRLMADNTPTLVWMSDRADKPTYFNRRWLEYTGRTLEQELAAGFQTDIFPEDRERLSGEFEKAFSERRGFEMEYRMRRRDGEFRWMLARGNPLVTGDGDFLGFLGSCTDIDDIKRVEAELRESEERIRIAVDAARLVTWEWDLQKDTVHWTDRSQAIMGTTTISNPSSAAEFFKVLHVDDVEAVRTRLLDSSTAGEPFDLEFRTRRPDGSFRWISAYGQITRSEGDRPLCLSGVASDITARKQAADELRRQAVLIELSQEPIFVWDLDDGIVEWNKGAEKLYGYTRDEAVGRTSHELLRGWTTGVDQYLNELERDGGWSGELTHYAKDGREVLVETRQQLMESGGRKLVLETNRDITERKFAERVLQRYRMLSEKSRDAIWFLNTDGRFMEVNDAAVANYGYTRDEFLTMNITDIRSRSSAGEIGRQLAEANLQGINFETTHLRKDGTEFSVDVTATAADFGDGRLIMAIVRDISERKAAETELMRSEERSQLAQAAGRVGIWDWNGITGQTYWSPSMWIIYGEEPSDINPDEEYWSAHLHPADRERALANIEHVRASGADTFHDEFRIIKKDGSVGWIESTATVACDDQGNAVRMYGVNIEITERKDAQDRVRLSENQLRLVTNAVPALISYVDRSERFRFANAKFEDWFGISPEDIVGRKVREVFGNAAYGVVKPWIQKALSGEKCTFETVLTYRKVGHRYVNISYMPDVDVDGTVHGYYSLTHDLTDLKRSEDLLRTSEARLGLMMENLTDYAILSLDNEGTIDSWNRGAELIFGYSRDEAIGLDGAELFTTEDRERGVHLKELENARTKGRAIDERWHLRNDGSRFFASGVMIPLYAGERLTGYAKIASDLTEKRRQAEELQRAHDELEVRVNERTRELAEANLALMAEMEVREDAERQRADLLGRLVSSQEVERRRIARDLHDQLGQRLTALRLKIQSLHEMAGDNDLIAARVLRLQEISEQLDAEVSFLAWELRPTALDDLGLVDAVGAFVTEWSRHYEISAEFHSHGLTAMRLDHDIETHLYRISQEALNNIVKHAEASNVSVMLEKRGENVILIIEDDGKGFDPADESLFNSSSGGLGLVGMRERAWLVKGNVEIESAPASGTTIFVRIPVV